jgi:CRP/FNR family transcriptional regulator, dissimilatory nitrate respiration regulator
MPSAISYDVVRTLPLFSGVTEQDKDALIKSGRLRHAPRGQMLFTHGEPVTHFYIIVSGTIQLFRATADGKEKTIDVLKASQTMCESEIMDSCSHHRVNAIPVEDSVVMEFPVEWLKETAKKQSAFALNLLSLIANQAHLAEVEAEHQAAMSAAQLVACFLQRLCVLYDFNPKAFDLPYSKTLIASRLGMELETFSRTVAKLKEHGIIVEGTKVSIHDIARIEHYVCGFCSVSEDCATHKAMEKKMSAFKAENEKQN